ncbi:MAG: FKBP-type peptidyl-prolyl cis-trans isomerase [Pseudomonadota bacterium]|nr:FKBP-type peptidyl-prolyl cis-trans isomerase [Pseudomonadota bacterium]
MKHITVACIMIAAAAVNAPVTAAPVTAAPAPAPPPAAASSAPDTAAVPPTADETSYLFGLTFGEQLHRLGIGDQLAIDTMARGFKDGLQGKRSTAADQMRLQEVVRSAMEAAIKQNQTAAKDFLARNAHEKGVTTTASGLQYKVLIPGTRTAAAVRPTDQVTVQYRGKLLDGSEFDSTYARGMPASFVVSGVIKGWQEALLLMKPGAKWQLFVPPALAYDTSQKPGIPGGSLLIFDVELISVKASGASN